MIATAPQPSPSRTPHHLCHPHHRTTTSINIVAPPRAPNEKEQEQPPPSTPHNHLHQHRHPYRAS
ncbi:hypothetical protein Hanom_Chr12g01090621 [Helianthus anomalus]